MRPERLAIQGKAERFARRLDVMMQELQLRFRGHANPYDARASKVRERADAADLRVDDAISRTHAAHRVGDPGRHVVRLLAQELYREVKLGFANPRELGRHGAQWRRRFGDGATDFRREINRQEESHAVTSRSLTPALRLPGGRSHTYGRDRWHAVSRRRPQKVAHQGRGRPAPRHHTPRSSSASPGRAGRLLARRGNASRGGRLWRRFLVRRAGVRHVANDAAKHIERSRAKAAQVDGDAREAGVEHGTPETPRHVWLEPAADLVRCELETGELTVKAHAQVTVDA